MMAKCVTDWASIPATGGDSGSPAILARDGQAVGMVVYTLGVLHPSAHHGHPFSFIMQRMQDAGWELTLVTAPFPA